MSTPNCGHPELRTFPTAAAITPTPPASNPWLPPDHRTGTKEQRMQALGERHDPVRAPCTNHAGRKANSAGPPQSVHGVAGRSPSPSPAGGRCGTRPSRDAVEDRRGDRHARPCPAVIPRPARAAPARARRRLERSRLREPAACRRIAVAWRRRRASPRQSRQAHRAGLRQDRPGRCCPPDARTQPDVQRTQPGGQGPALRPPHQITGCRRGRLDRSGDASYK